MLLRKYASNDKIIIKIEFAVKYSVKSADNEVDNICADQRGYMRGMIFTFALPFCVSSSSFSC